MSYTELESGYQGLKQDISNSSCSGLGGSSSSNNGSEGNGSASQTPSGRPGFYVGDDGAIITIGRVRFFALAHLLIRKRLFPAGETEVT